ncbi:hypothetical protein PLICRDRAFT_29180 [Plicaturopsis crispa FD-325 SS-3]|nr:hypothetical protein PLICRDRAFT_29180 [Plicaturopsis crispa FD-325 SS-3]
MSTAARQQKPARKGGPDPARRAPAWNGARASPTFSPSGAPARLPNGPPQGAFPPLGGQPNGNARTDNPQDRVLQNLSGLTGTTITLSTKTSQRYEGVVGSTSAEGDTTGVTLKDVKELSSPGAPLKETLFIATTNIDKWASGPADAQATNGDSFRTDTDISQKAPARQNRELQAWQPDPDSSGASTTLTQGDDLTFGHSANNTSWDQFAANEKLFGVKTGFDEDLYTTKLDRSAADFKERERKAQKIANEIIGSATNNPHIAEERNMVVDDSGVNEEDKYGAVVRGTNAYVPPGARRGGVTSPTETGKSDAPKVTVNTPDGAAASQPSAQTSSSSKAASPAPSSNGNKPPADPLPAFRDFVTNEKVRLTQKRQALVKSEMDKRMAELVKFSQSFKLNKPIPDDLVPILAKDEEKQKQIREKSTKDAHAPQARNIGIASTAGTAPNVASSRVPAVLQSGKHAPDATRKATPAPPGSAKAPPASAQKPAAAAAKPAEPAKKGAISMFIQPIPAFKGPKQSRPAANSNNANGSSAPRAPAAPVPSAPAPAANPPMSPNTANRLNVNAHSFRPNTKATPSPSTQSASLSPKPKQSDTPRSSSTPNPFFGTRVIKKNTPVHIKDDFNPFKHNKVVEAGQVSAIWPYSGKRYMLMFPPLQHQPPQQSPHMMAPGPPPIPPPSYEEDSAQQAAARGYVYASNHTL